MGNTDAEAPAPLLVTLPSISTNVGVTVGVDHLAPKRFGAGTSPRRALNLSTQSLGASATDAGVDAVVTTAAASIDQSRKLRRKTSSGVPTAEETSLRKYSHSTLDGVVAHCWLSNPKCPGSNLTVTTHFLSCGR